LDSEIELLDRDWRDESTGESGRELGQIEDLQTAFVCPRRVSTAHPVRKRSLNDGGRQQSLL
jgi:hypothetical protein